MFFSIKKPQSKRFARFILYSRGEAILKRGVFGVFKDTFTFLSYLVIYILRKLNSLFTLLARILFSIGVIPIFIKNEVVRKLIWSRGKLGRPVATALILSISMLVFWAGEFLSGSTLVVNAETTADYFEKPVDIIPKKEIATTEIPEIRKRVESFEYTIEGGDTLYGIGEKFKVSADALMYINGMTDNSVLTVGKKIIIPPVSGLVHTVKSGDTLSSIADKYSVSSQAIADFNYLLNTTKLAVGAELVIPGAKVPEPVAPPIYLPPVSASTSSLGQASPSKNFCVWPSTVRIITQYFSWYHNGLDVATPWSGGMPPIFSCTGGTVIRAGWDPYGLGLHVRIDHGNGYETVYGHMSRLDVSYGQKVSRGQAIGLMGNTGRSTGPHLHFIVKFNGVAQNPFNYTN